MSFLVKAKAVFKVVKTVATKARPFAEGLREQSPKGSRTWKAASIVVAIFDTCSALKNKINEVIDFCLNSFANTVNEIVATSEGMEEAAEEPG